MKIVGQKKNASNFSVFDWLLTSLTYLTQSTNILSVATQVYLPFQCGAVARFLFTGPFANLFFPFFLHPSPLR